MIKAVLFDFDGVLTLDATGSESVCNYISKTTGFDNEIFTKEYRKHNADLLFGRTTHEEIWERICSGIKQKININILYDSFIDTPINTEMLTLVKNIKNMGYETGLITDNKKDRIDHITKHFNLDEIFDVITVSAAIGSGKDNDKIFHETIKQLSVKSNECVFIDNQEKNLIVPKRMGMEVIFFNHEKNDIGELKKELREIEIKI